jgi:hypothetical protein
MSPYWPGRISVEIYGITGTAQKPDCQQTGIEFVTELGCEQGAHNLTSSEEE